MDVGKDYIGDGVYAESDGDSIVLKANDPVNPTDTIYLDRYVFAALVNFEKRMRGA